MTLLRQNPACVCLALLAACASGPRAYKDAKMDFSAVRAVAVLPLNNLSRDNYAADRVRDVFSSMLLATGALYVLPAGEVGRGVQRAAVASAPNPTTEEIVNLGKTLNIDAVITGTVKEYGEVRSGTAAANVVSMSLQMYETQTGKVVWSAVTTKGGVGFVDRLVGGGGEPLNNVTEDAARDLLRQLFR